MIAARIMSTLVTRLVLLHLLSLPSLVWGQSLEVHELDEQPARHLNKQVIVRGRLQSAGGGHLRMLGSTTDFRYSEARVPIGSNTTHIEVVGRVSRQGEGLVVAMESLKPVPSEVQDFAARREKVRDGNFAALYELSRWARARAKWYDDHELRELATQSYRQAYAIEEDFLAQTNDLDGLLELADRGEQLRLEAVEVQRIRFRALVLMMARLPVNNATAWSELATRARQLLPGTETPGKAAEQPTKDRTVEQWLAAIKAAEPSDRPRLHRELWCALEGRAYDLRALGDVNLLQLAREARQALPEREGLARRIELTGWRRQAEHPGNLSREQLVAVRDGLIRLEQVDDAKSLVARWLRHRRDALPDGEAEDRVQLADDFAELAADRTTAAELYREALAIVPNFDLAAGGMRKLGYELIGGAWRDTRSADLAERPEDSLKAGMSETEVVRRLRRPDRVTRTATRLGIVEQWTYTGPPELILYLRRDAIGGAAAVTRVSSP